MPVLSDWEGVASFLVVENPGLLDRGVEAQAAALGVGVGDVRALWRNRDFRLLVDEVLASSVFSVDVRRRQYEVVRDISLEGERDADRLKAFDVASRQARVKVPERHEVDDRKSVEVKVSRLPFEEGGFVPETSFNGPEGRRSRLGERVEREAIEEVRGRGGGPFDASAVVVDVEGGAINDLEEGS